MVPESFQKLLYRKNYSIEFLKGVNILNTPLAQLNPGEKGKVERIHACGYAAKRLYEMGFNIGAIFEVVKNDRGPVVVSLFGNNIAVGRRLAQKIIVSQSN